MTVHKGTVCGNGKQKWDTAYVVCRERERERETGEREGLREDAKRGVNDESVVSEEVAKGLNFVS